MTNEQQKATTPEVKPYEGNVDLDLTGLDPEKVVEEEAVWKEEFEEYDGQKEYEKAYMAHLKDPAHVPMPNKSDYVFEGTDADIDENAA